MKPKDAQQDAQQAQHGRHGEMLPARGRLGIIERQRGEVTASLFRLFVFDEATASGGQRRALCIQCFTGHLADGRVVVQPFLCVLKPLSGLIGRLVRPFSFRSEVPQTLPRRGETALPLLNFVAARYGGVKLDETLLVPTRAQLSQGPGHLDRVSAQFRLSLG